MDEDSGLGAMEIILIAIVLILGFVAVGFAYYFFIYDEKSRRRGRKTEYVDKTVSESPVIKKTKKRVAGDDGMKDLCPTTGSDTSAVTNDITHAEL